jgi:ribosomal protein S18 acetylase RimI-like enzyme
MRTRPCAGEPDLPRILDLLLVCRDAGYLDMELYSTGLRIILRDPAFDLAGRTLLVENDIGALVGFGVLWRGYVLGSLTHPTVRVMAMETLLDWATGCVRTQEWPAGKERLLMALCRDDDALGRDVLLHAGFIVDEIELRMGRPLNQPVRASVLPPGFAIRSLAGTSEVEAWNALYHEAFGDHMTLLSRHETVMDDTGYDPALDIVAVAPDGSLAAVCYCAIPAYEAEHPSEMVEGRTEPIAVSARYRRMGLGRAIVSAGLRALRERGVSVAMLTTESDNAPAHALYHALGYRALYNALWCSRAV